MARVLVIEDNDINLALMQYLLGAFGHTVLVARDGEEGLRMLRTATPADQPDIVVCDIEMPRMDGVAFAGAVRADPALAQLPLLAVTSSAMVGDRDRFIQAGFDDYAAKPIDTERFVGWMERHLRPGGADLPPPAVHDSLPAPLLPEGDGPHVLVLDDEPVNLALKRAALRPLGYRVSTARHADAALALALQDPPQLIITDVGMPEADGFDFICRVLRQPVLQHVPFIFITATHWDTVTREKALALGARRFLRRPLPTEELLAEVAAALQPPRA
jgi:two-component system cell cycle response regulator